MALVVLSVVEQRLDAVRAVLAGMDVVETAAKAGVHRATVHRWVARYLSEQIGGLADRSHRPVLCPHQADPVVEVAVADMRRMHPRWGSRRILARHGLLRQRPKESFIGFQRAAPMQLGASTSSPGSSCRPGHRSAVRGRHRGR